MNTKINKCIILIGAICTIIPLEISTSSIIKYILSYLPMLIGYMLYFEEYKKYALVVLCQQIDAWSVDY